MARVVIVGTRDTASLADHYLTSDSEYEVVAFTVDREFVTASQFAGKPVVPFDELLSAYPPDQFALFAPMTHRGMNRARAGVVARAIQMGYDLASYVSSWAIVPPNFEAGPNTMILEGAIIQPFVQIGANVMIWSGAHVAHHSTVGDHAFLAPPRGGLGQRQRGGVFVRRDQRHRPRRPEAGRRDPRRDGGLPHSRHRAVVGLHGHPARRQPGLSSDRDSF